VADVDELLALGDQLAIGLSLSGRLPGFAWLAVDLGRVGDARSAFENSPVFGWHEVARAILAGEAARAADLLAEIGDRPAEAYARLRAGGEQVQRALDFYRSVGATRFIGEADSLLTASVKSAR
jgi:hypothetical protein